MTPRQLVLIRNALARGEPKAAIARRHGLTPRAIYNVEHGVSWAGRKQGRPIGSRSKHPKGKLKADKPS